jgi:hypothetical protein
MGEEIVSILMWVVVLGGLLWLLAATTTDDDLYGSVNSAVVCPHCHTAGHCRVKTGRQKTGISGAKATAAILTGGTSLLATGLSKKETVSEVRCGNCGLTSVHR